MVNGEPTTFGTSGLLFRSNKVMYDRATNTLWHQFTGTPIIGELQGSGIQLEWFPTARTTWGAWREEHPESTVLDRDEAIYPPRNYLNESNPRSIYFPYRADPETMFPIATRNDMLPAKTEVLGVAFEGEHRAYAIPDLRRERIVHDEIGGVPVVVIASSGTSDAHIYRNDSGLQLSLPDGASADNGGFPAALVDSGGRRYTATRYAITRDDGSGFELPHIPSNVNFWFGWFAFHPETSLYAKTVGSE